VLIGGCDGDHKTVDTGPNNGRRRHRPCAGKLRYPKPDGRHGAVVAGSRPPFAPDQFLARPM